ncbi:MAG: hypothetical protein OXN16_08275 [Gammaproteobacteria bacterium]|nr:hypothetical protein [Gammaproteobacteria bacterium]
MNTIGKMILAGCLMFSVGAWGQGNIVDEEAKMQDFIESQAELALKSPTEYRSKTKTIADAAFAAWCNLAIQHVWQEAMRKARVFDDSAGYNLADMKDSYAIIGMIKKDCL